MSARRRSTVLVMLTFLLAGCPPTTPPAASNGPYTPDQIAVVTDPCPQRLQDIANALLQYFHDKKDLPASLESLRAFVGVDLKLVCPTSNKPYVYAPKGMRIEGEKWILFVYDADAVHNGVRWTIVGMQDPQGNVIMDVRPMDNPTLQKFINASLFVAPAP